MHKGQPLRRTRFLSRYIRVLSSINSEFKKGEKIVPSCVYFPRKTSYREVSAVTAIFVAFAVAVLTEQVYRMIL